MSKYLKA